MKKRSILVAPKMFCAVVFLALCGLITPAAACWTVSLEATLASFPRDNNHTSTVIATVKQGEVAKSGQTVSFSVTGPGTLSATSAGPTDAFGQCSITVKSSDIEASSAQITVTGTCQGASSPPLNVTANGLVMTLTSSYSKIYIASVWHNSTTLTCTVKDTTNIPASGTISFSTYQGTVNPTSRALDGTGVATSNLTPGNEAYTDTASSTLGSITKTVQPGVVFADQVKIKTKAEPHKEKPNYFVGEAKLYDQEDTPFPGADVSFQWQVASNLTETDIIRTPYPPADVEVAAQSPSPTGDGFGAVGISTTRIGAPQVPLKSSVGENWTNLTLRLGDANSLKATYEVNQNCQVTIDGNNIAIQAAFNFPW